MANKIVMMMTRSGNDDSLLVQGGSDRSEQRHLGSVSPGQAANNQQATACLD